MEKWSRQISVDELVWFLIVMAVWPGNGGQKVLISFSVSRLLTISQDRFVAASLWDVVAPYCIACVFNY